MPRGPCPLCQFDRELVDSHYIPAGAYKPLHASELPVNEPMVLTNKRIFQSSRQITAHAFCLDCERKLNREGEDWVLEKLAMVTSFPLRDMVTAALPILDEPDFKVFCAHTIPGFEMGKIIHLALGMFWKSAVRTWNMIDGPVERIELGPYQEPIREYLLGRRPFPKDMCLVTFLDSNTPPLIAVTPPRRFQNEGFHLFIFYMNGLKCMFCVGKQIPQDYRACCLASSPDHPIFLDSLSGESMLRAMKSSTRQSKPSKGVLETLEQWKRLMKQRRG
jgi:hypothetical protein